MIGLKKRDIKKALKAGGISHSFNSSYRLYVLCGLFLYPKKFFHFFSKSCNKSHLAVQIWCGKRDKHFSRHNGKGV